MVDFSFTVWDVDNFAPDDEGVYGPAKILDFRFDRNTLAQPGAFSKTGALDFDFEAGTHYVVTTELLARGFNGGSADVYNTARLQDVLLSGGATMATLSGHTYVADVPEPQTLLLLGLGLAALLWRARRHAAGA